MKNLIERIETAMAKYRLTFGDELTLQNQIAEIFQKEGIEFDREVILEKASRLDFAIPFAPGDWHVWAVEVKIAGSVETHLRQMKRYNGHPDVVGTILIGTRPFVLPETLGGKPVGLINIGNKRL